MTAWEMLLIGTAVVMMVMAVAWGLQFPLRNAGVVDVAWAGCLAFLGIFYSLQESGSRSHHGLVSLMAGVWGGRLAIHLLLDRVIGQPEDGRYATLRKKWGGSWPLKSFFFFQFQALLCVLLSFPFLIVAMQPRSTLNVWEWLGLAIWFMAVLGEMVADQQLKKFKANTANKGKTCRVGLWSFSRHPNYFFEWLVWVSWFIAACGSAWGWISIYCPMLMLFFLLRVTGIPATEEQALKSRGEDYREYQRTTSMFIPWWPKPKGQIGC